MAKTKSMLLMNDEASLKQMMRSIYVTSHYELCVLELRKTNAELRGIVKWKY